MHGHHDTHARVGGGGMHFTPSEQSEESRRARQDRAERIESDHRRRMSATGPREHGRPCPECEGGRYGGRGVTNACPECHGTGRA